VNKLFRLYHTIKYLKVIQVYYQVYYRVKRKLGIKSKYKPYEGHGSISWKNVIHWNNQWRGGRSFNFLNIAHTFDEEIDWNYSGYGKLWTYNLNYFDWLHQKNINADEATIIIKQYIEDKLEDGLEPYPTSLRIINWIKFLGQHNVEDQVITEFMYNDAIRLSSNLEYHLLANHLLENAFALTFAGVFLNDSKIYRKGSRLLKNQISEQILQDGAHYELSPMYHQLMLYRVLDTIQLLEKNNSLSSKVLVSELREKASDMLSWLENIVFWHGDIPLFNDSAQDINPSISDLSSYAVKLNVISSGRKLGVSGYRKLRTEFLELVANIANIGPSYQPGHAHADSLSFVLYAGFDPFVIDRGISTYEKNEKRKEERSTAAHNTVSVANQNSSDTWGGFRVGRRAKVNILLDKKNELEASHTGYLNRGVIHTRKWHVDSKCVTIDDRISGSAEHVIAHFHLHPTVTVRSCTKDTVQTNLGNLDFENSTKVTLTEYDFANSFNQLIVASKISVSFVENLTTTININ